MQTHTTNRRANRVYKSLHKPLTYLGVERTLFFFVCVAAVGAFNLFNSLLAGLLSLCGRVCFRVLGDRKRSRISSHPCEIRKVQSAIRRSQASSPACGGALMMRIDKIIKPWKESAALNDHINLYRPLE